MKYESSYSLGGLLALLLAASPAFGQVADTSSGDRSLDSLLGLNIQTASKYWQRASESPSSVTIITSSEIAEHGYQTLEEVIGVVRSFYSSNDKNYTYIGVRGFSRPTDYNNRLLLLVNGHTLNEGFYGSSPFGLDFGIDLRAIDRIEIVRGAGSVLYGSGAMFAIVNVVTKTGMTFDDIRVSGSLGSAGERHATFTLGNEDQGGLDMFVSGSWRRADGFDLYFSEYDTDSTNRGIAEGLDWNRSFGLFCGVSYGEFKLQALLMNSEKGVPTASFDSKFNDPRYRTQDRYGYVEAKVEHEFSPSLTTMARGYFDSYYYEGDYPYEELLSDMTTSRRVGTELQARWDPSPENRVIAGSELIRSYRSDYNTSDVTATYFRGDFPYGIASVYVQDEWQLMEKLSVIAGLRKDFYQSQTVPLSPRFAMVYTPTPSTTGRIILGRAFRTPNNYERHYFDNIYKRSEGLRPEAISSVEAVLDQRLSRSMATILSVHVNDLTNLIDPEIDPSDSLIQFRNVTHVRAWGVEAEWNVRLPNSIGWNVSYSYERTKSLTSLEPLTNSPVHVIKADLSGEVPGGVRAGVDVQYQTSRRTVYGAETGGWFLANLMLATHLGGFAESLPFSPEVSLSVRNLFDRRYELPGGYEHRQPGILQNGRRALLTFAATF